MQVANDALLVRLNVQPRGIQIIEWKRQLIERASEVFSGGTAGPPIELKPFHAKIGQHALEIDFLAGALDKAGL